MTPVSRDGTLEASTSKSPYSPQSSITSATLMAFSPRHNPSYRRYGLPEGVWLLSSPSEAGPSRRQIHIRREFHSMVAGAGAGLVSSIVTCPLDVVKTTLQAQRLARDAPGYEGVGKTCRRIWRQSGFRGFYRGLGPTVAGYLPTWGIYFTVYDLVKDRLRGWAEGGKHRDADVALMHIVAAMSAGATGTCLTNPLWVVKTRFMAQAVLPPTAARYRNTLDAIVTIYRTEGLRAFYKGLLPSLVGVSHVAIQLPLYEQAKSWADRDGDHSNLPPSTILACSAFSKMVASLITYPHEVLRTRIQIRKSHTIPTAEPSTASSTAAKPIISETPATSATASSARLPPAHARPSHHYHAIPSSTFSAPHLYSPLVTGSQPPLPAIEANNVPQITDGSPPKKYYGQRGGIIHTFLKIQRQDGWRGFYRGLSINLVRTVPNAAVTFLTYELIMRNLN